MMHTEVLAGSLLPVGGHGAAAGPKVARNGEGSSGERFSMAVNVDGFAGSKRAHE